MLIAKYYLCGDKYNTHRFMTPYSNTRYRLADFQWQSALRKEEIFNHAHAQLINVIDHTHRISNALFSILKQMTPYHFEVQRYIVIACFSVLNFIRKCNINDKVFTNCEEDNIFIAKAKGGKSNDKNIHNVEWDS